jgi:hypothetical protein
MWSPGFKSFKQSEVWRTCAGVSTGGALSLSQCMLCSIVCRAKGEYLQLKNTLWFQHRALSCRWSDQVGMNNFSIDYFSSGTKIFPAILTAIIQCVGKGLAQVKISKCWFKAHYNRYNVSDSEFSLSIPCLKGVCLGIIAELCIITWQHKSNMSVLKPDMNKISLDLPKTKLIKRNWYQEFEDAKLIPRIGLLQPLPHGYKPELETKTCHFQERDTKPWLNQLVNKLLAYFYFHTWV